MAAKRRKKRKKYPRPAAQFLRFLRLFAAINFLAKRADSAEQQCKERKAKRFSPTWESFFESPFG